jgi:hypothetical protein
VSARVREVRRPSRLTIATVLVVLSVGTTAPATASTTPAPGFKLRALQKVLGNGTEFSAGRQRAKLGQTIDYEIIVKNTGSTPLTFATLVDKECDPGTMTGGPGVAEVLPGGSTTFTCVHLYTEADKAAGPLVNTATETGTPPAGDGLPLTRTSNRVEVLPRPPGVEQELTCEGVRVTFFDFPNREGNEATVSIREERKLVYRAVFEFDGPTAIDTVPLSLPVGIGPTVIGHVAYVSNGVKRVSYRRRNLFCLPDRDYSVEKLQKVEGGSEEFTTGTIVGKVGETIDYEVLVTNTGNAPLPLAFLQDQECDTGTIAGGPGANDVEIGGTTTYTCDHVLTAADALKGSFSNIAWVWSPPVIEGTGFISRPSNKVVAEVEPEGP